MNIDQNTGEVVNQGRSPRFTLWVAFLAFSTITMGSAVGVVRSPFANAVVGRLGAGIPKISNSLTPSLVVFEC